MINGSLSMIKSERVVLAQTNSYGLQPLLSSSPSPLTAVAHAASVLFYCTSSRISRCSLRVLSESLCACGKQSASSVCYCTSPLPTASTYFQLKVEEGGRRGTVKSTPQLDKRRINVKILHSTLKDNLIPSCGHETILK